eukprot:2287518-Pleurochrysis_carterae.AAC.1
MNHVWISGGATAAGVFCVRRNLSARARAAVRQSISNYLVSNASLVMPFPFSQKRYLTELHEWRQHVR